VNASHVCAWLLTQAQGYIARKTALWPQERVLRALGQEAVHAAELPIDAALLAGDPEAMKVACRAWWDALLREGL